MKKIRPRFIAGAVCPSCGAMDRLKFDPEDESRHCVACGYADSLASPSSQAPKNRLEGGLKKAAEREPPRVVQIVDLKRPEEEP